MCIRDRPIDGSSATAKILEKRYPGGRDAVLELPGNALDIIMLIDDYKAKKKEIDEAITTQENRLKDMMGDNEIAVAGNRKITWKTYSGSVSVDKKALAKDLPEVFEKYSKIRKPSRRFLIAPKKKGEK